MVMGILEGKQLQIKGFFLTKSLGKPYGDFMQLIFSLRHPKMKI